MSADRLRSASRAALASAAEAGCGPGAAGGDDSTLQEALASAADDLAARVARRPPAPPEYVALLRRLDELRGALRAAPAVRGLHAIADARDGLERLRAVEGADELLRQAPREVCRSCRVDRCVVALADGLDLVVAYACFADDPHAERLYLDHAGGARRPVAGAPLESELVRRRIAALLPADAVPQSIVASGQAPPFAAHVAAPVVVGDRSVAVLYAGGSSRDVSEPDRDALRWFAAGLAELFERAVLSGRLRAQRDHVRRLATSATAVMSELRDAEIELHPAAGGAGADPAGAVVAAPGRRPEDVLTPRELEVLELMAAGVGNAGLAERLVIAEGTVKSHVKHILRKLHAANRAEAVARYLHQRLEPTG